LIEILTKNFDTLTDPDKELITEAIKTGTYDQAKMDHLQLLIKAHPIVEPQKNFDL